MNWTIGLEEDEDTPAEDTSPPSRRGASVAFKEGRVMK